MARSEQSQLLTCALSSRHRRAPDRLAGAPRGLDRLAKIGQKALLPPLFAVAHPPASRALIHAASLAHRHCRSRHRWSRGHHAARPPGRGAGAPDRPANRDYRSFSLPQGEAAGIDLASFAWFDDCVALARSPGIDLFVELIGGEEGAALAAAEAALGAGKSVVTANKALLAKHGMRLAALAEENGIALAFEASVAGGIPIVKTLREGLAGNSIERVQGILNGTCTTS